MKYLETKNAIYGVIENANGTITIYSNSGKGKEIANAGKFILGMGGLDAVKARLVDVKPVRKNTDCSQKNEQLVKDAYETVKNPDASALEIFRALKDIVKNEPFSTAFAENTITGDNALTKALVAFGGSYVASVYDNGEFIVKYDDGRRFSSSRVSFIRGAGNIYDIVGK